MITNGIQVVQELDIRFPGIQVLTDPPGNKGGSTWWYDLEFKGHKVTVEWKPGNGFGFYKGEAAYGEGPGEVFRDFDALALRLSQEFHE